MDVPIPEAQKSTQLIELAPRIARVELLQRSQAKEVGELRERTAGLLQKWYVDGVMGRGEEWAGIEGRVGGVERKVRGAERRKLDEV